ncbi:MULTISPECIES: hypothetical protein [unclassified Streptomyces]|uniref:hypothetical protein n=1 Tax=unclassified Streptomyces TaxID=2593676 RepID=UPI002DDB2BC9|nr:MULTISPECIES: hypothetical protein [unclassified Streptomyces]WSA96678.1 hypothetical protein OIE63_37860 [Streptomyces sp. NBC_01795]WSB81093.1 hypothetical protein OHB04_38980 [Streptomyces sp. NBC_01775]WSS10695.1 hypothetical protein OG533_01280 [Streptomyces sp. NBC_01186]WSS39392.1 hypothetical protein OG220_01305 [Streptomyces sp. NBC_01187]
MSAMLGKTVPGHAGPCVRAGQGCTCYYYPDENGTRTRSAEQKRRRRIARRREQRSWRAEFVVPEHA